MSKGTRLFQPTGSPLIQGASKTERSWTTSFVGALLIGLSIYFLGIALVEMSMGADMVDALAAAATRFLTVGLWAGLAGAAAGVSIVRSWGARRGWLSGAAFCVVTILVVELVVGLIL